MRSLRPSKSTPPSRWTGFVDALLADAPTETAWAEGVVEVSRSILPAATGASLHILEFDGNNVPKRHRLSVPEERRESTEAAIASHLALCPSGLSLSLAPPKKSRGAPTPMHLQLVARPAENVVTCVVWYFDEPPIISKVERQLLERLAFHLDAAQRVRERPESVRAVLSDRGRIMHRQDDVPDLWPALLDGRVSIVARSVGSREEYLVLENTPAARRDRALTLAEAATLRLASQGMSNKLMAYGLGISSTAVSRHLASAATKLGLASRAELIRIAALLVHDQHAAMEGEKEEDLTSAEREILALLQRGLSNQQIATLRARSVRTIANQVASLLRKTGTGSRRELTVRRGVEQLDHVAH